MTSPDQKPPAWAIVLAVALIVWAVVLVSYFVIAVTTGLSQ